MNDHFFLYKDNVEGKVAIGKIPENLKYIIEDISKEYYNEIPDKTVSTYHTWFENMKPSIKRKVELVQNDPFWANLCDKSPKCVRISAKEMDELYYSNVPNNTNKINLYGATGNYDIHRDCIYNFNGIKFYRILIGLTDGNNNVRTHFTNLDVGHKLNKNDFIVFDFDNTTHQVIKENNKDTPRILLKLHYIVCENCQYSREYVNKIRQLYLYYEFITRYVMQTGTDPETFYQFFLGLLCQFYMHKFFGVIFALLCIIIVVFLRYVLKIKLVFTNFLKVIAHLTCILFIIFISIVTLYWVRFLMFGIK